MSTITKSPMYDRILERYLKDYITEAQLDRYVTLKQITEEEADIMRIEKNPDQSPSILPEDSATAPVL